jgi:hypothetical protein
MGGLAAFVARWTLGQGAHGQPIIGAILLLSRRKRFEIHLAAHILA